MSKTTVFSQFVKPYSRGQITIPQEFRDYLGIDENKWLFLTIKNKAIIIKPIKEKEILKEESVNEQKKSFGKYLKTLPAIKGLFGEEIARENLKIRKQVEKKLTSLDL